MSSLGRATAGKLMQEGDIAFIKKYLEAIVPAPTNPELGDEFYHTSGAA